MGERKDKVAEYRRQAAICMEIARQMSLIEDRQLMLEMAEKWLELARKLEAAED
jgi:hypothetical protein